MNDTAKVGSVNPERYVMQNFAAIAAKKKEEILLPYIPVYKRGFQKTALENEKLCVWKFDTRTKNTSVWC